MSYYTKGGGITKLCQLLIDADKVWAAFGISNIKEVVAGMATGDIIARGPGGVLVKIIPGAAAQVLTSAGPLHIPVWAPAPGPLRLYYPAEIFSMIAASVVAVDKQANPPNAAITTSLLSQLAPSFSPTMTTIPTEVVVPVDEQANPPVANVVAAKTYYIYDAIGGAVADDGGVETNETVAANNDATNDMTLLPLNPAVGDAYDFGYANVFPALRFYQSTPGNGTWTITWKYWDGAAWADCVDPDDDTSGWHPSSAGYFRFSHTPQGDWALKVIQGMNLYWLRAECTNFINRVTQPKGQRAWIQVGAG